MPKLPPPCRAKLNNGLYCKHAGVVERDGKHYCHQHDPESVAKRKAAVTKTDPVTKLAKKRAADRTRDDRKNACVNFCGPCTKEQLESFTAAGWTLDRLVAILAEHGPESGLSDIAKLITPAPQEPPTPQETIP